VLNLYLFVSKAALQSSDDGNEFTQQNAFFLYCYSQTPPLLVLNDLALWLLAFELDGVE
jgi:hypothetical protein